MTAFSMKRLLWITCFAVISYALPIIHEEDAVMYLKQYGYMKESISPETFSNHSQEISVAIRKFQIFAGINETGRLDIDTIAKMNVPRCGVEDKIIDSTPSRKKRYALRGGKWHKKDLTYGISKYPSLINDRTGVDNVIARAFQVWSNVSTLTFKADSTEGAPDIDIRFEAGDHGDRQSFDGQGGLLGHGWFPETGGNVHFDDEERWIINGNSFPNLFKVAVHEFGHLLGLGHSQENQAVMSPFYQDSEFQNLHSDDIAAIRSLYDDDTVKDSPTYSSEDNIEDMGPQPYRDSPDICSDVTIDTIVRLKNGGVYACKGDYYVLLLPDGIANGYPKRISDYWRQLPGNLDASFTTTRGKIYFFKGSQCWRFTNQRMDSGYPKSIAEEFEGIPNDLDAAFVWGANNVTYFFKGDNYWRYDFNSAPPVSSDYPMSITTWSELLNGGIDAAVQWNSGYTYFFKDQQYYRYHDAEERIENGYPRSTAVTWLDCQCTTEQYNREKRDTWFYEQNHNTTNEAEDY